MYVHDLAMNETVRRDLRRGAQANRAAQHERLIQKKIGNHPAVGPHYVCLRVGRSS